MKVGDKVVIVKPLDTEKTKSDGCAYWAKDMDTFIGIETEITGNCACDEAPKRTEYFYIENDLGRFVWREEWLKLDIPKEDPINEVIDELDVYVCCDNDEYSAAIEELIHVHPICGVYSQDLIDAIETQLRHSLAFYKCNFNVKQRTVIAPSYVENYLEEK
jgi:hypothetical protein